MMVALVGYTGFVGSNIASAGGEEIGARYNTKNIADAFGTRPDLLIYAGLRAEKYLANTAPEKDLELVREAERNIERIAPKKLVLISTIDVFNEPRGVNELSPIQTEGLHPYGYNRYMLEQWTRAAYPDALIVRLPGLFGKNIKKNFIYDLIHYIPSALNGNKMEELSGREPALQVYYELQSNGFYRVKPLSAVDEERVKALFRSLRFSALDFTDSRSRYQFYDLGRLWTDLQVALREGLRVWHPATEPVSAAEVYYRVTGEVFENELDGPPADYDYRTLYGEVFGGNKQYICDKETVISDIVRFVEREKGVAESQNK